MTRGTPIPRHPINDYSNEQAKVRRDFIKSKTRASLDMIGKYAIDPDLTRENIENLIGTAQVPLDLAGPLRIEGEYARGDFYVPLATTEGTLIASYSRGMRAISTSGGVRTTVVKHSM